MGPACPAHSNGDAGHDDKFSARTLVALVNSLLMGLDKGDCEGRSGLVEI